MSWALDTLANNLESWPGVWIDLASKSSMMLALAAVTTFALRRRSAATRHFVWMLAFVGLLVLPFFSFALPSWRVSIGTRAAPTSQAKEFLFSSSLEADQPAANLTPGGANSRATGITGEIGGSRQLARSQVPAGLQAPEQFAVLLWAIGCATGFVPLVIGYLNLARLRSRARRVERSTIEQLARALAGHLGIGREVTVLLSDRSCMPMTWGLRRPIVLLPLAAERWSVSRLRPVLVHELAHVQRFDVFTQFIVQLVRAVYWYNPFVWVAQRHMRLEQETACDDMVLNAGLDPQQYAAQLLSITAGLPAHYLASSVALAMAKKRTLERRLLAILDTGRDRRSPRRPALIFALTLLIASMALLGPMRFLVGQPAAARAAGSLVSLDSLSQGVDQQALAKTLDEVRAKIQSLAVDAPAEKVLLEGALRGMLEAMHDPYSSYLPASDAMPMDATQASMVGIGIQVRKADQGVVVISPLPNSPARKAGLKPGDVILAVDGRLTSEMKIGEVVQRIRGLADSSVELKVCSSGVDREMSLTRAAVAIPTVQGFERKADDTWNHLIDPEAKIGYIQIAAFNGGTAQEFRQTLEQLLEAGMAGLVLDLRFCPGGLFNSTVGVAQMLLDQGNIVSIKGRDMREQTVGAEGKSLLGNRPMVVLVNEQTASGGEILAGALKENNRAIILGSRTHGKGSVQSIVNLGSEKGAIKLTTGQLYLPSGRMIQKSPSSAEWGVDPTDGFYMRLTAKQIIALEERLRERQLLDHKAGDAPKSMSDPADPQLTGALKTLSAKLTRGEFEKVGRPIAEFAIDLKNVQAEQLRLKRQLAEIERELEVLGAKEPKSS